MLLFMILIRSCMLAIKGKDGKFNRKCCFLCHTVPVRLSQAPGEGPLFPPVRKLASSAKPCAGK